MTHTVPDPEPGDYPTELDPDEVHLHPEGVEHGGQIPSDDEVATVGPDYQPAAAPEKPSPDPE